ncbi:MAG: hypothetical protein QXM07_09535 [Nitrososphaerota archaeon]
MLFLDNFRLVEQGILEEYAVGINEMDKELFQAILTILNKFNIDYSLIREKEKIILVARKHV